MCLVLSSLRVRRLLSDGGPGDHAVEDDEGGGVEDDVDVVRVRRVGEVAEDGVAVGGALEEPLPDEAGRFRVLVRP